jgi:hypothetical protein
LAYGCWSASRGPPSRRSSVPLTSPPSGLLAVPKPAQAMSSSALRSPPHPLGSRYLSTTVDSLRSRTGPSVQTTLMFAWLDWVAAGASCPAFRSHFSWKRMPGLVQSQLQKSPADLPLAPKTGNSLRGTPTARERAHPPSGSLCHLGRPKC